LAEEPRGPSPQTIELTVAAWERMAHELANDPEIDDDEAAISTELAINAGLVHPDRLIERCVRAIAFATMRAKEADTFAKTYRARKARYDKRASLLRTTLFNLMELMRHKRYRALEGTVSIRAGTQSVLVTDEQAIPDEYFKTVKTLKKKELLDDLKQGAVVDGAFLSNGASTLIITGIQPINESYGEGDEQEEATTGYDAESGREEADV
jgi:Siphovirus Gp157